MSTSGIVQGKLAYSRLTAVPSGSNILLLDTPDFDQALGFGEAVKTDKDILQNVHEWMSNYCQGHRRLVAILYFHRLTGPRMQGSPLQSIGLLKKSCGKTWASNFVLGTTFWGILDAQQPRLAEQRETELRETKEFWGEMQDGEAKSFDAILKESQLGAYDMLVQEAFGTLSYPGAGGTLRSSLYPQAVPFILTSDNCFENVEADENFSRSYTLTSLGLCS
ncbi:hypothetical protein BDZ45DRAFT_741533 [Acephala macrosclerotiorum]|nr:hypothetical protein BDZ45DRAFT_741533 [Acephala macrosclerotiorum]